MKTDAKKYIIFDVLQSIHSNKIILPSIQRDFVWTKQQLISLFDSIMLGYPISTFLFWNINGIEFGNNSYFYQFLKNVTFNFQGKSVQSTSSSIDSNIVDKDTFAVLDGQQRLTSLYISLMGRANTKTKYARQGDTQVELYLDLNSGSVFFDDEELIEDEFNEVTKDSHAYTFNFQLLPSSPDKKKWFKVKDILPLKDINSRESKINNFLSQNIDSTIHERAKKNLTLMAKRIFDESVINVSELGQCGLDEALEIFIRFNRGGTQLSKSDLVFSTIQSRWSEAKEKVESSLTNINEKKYRFSKDFIVRLALVLFGQSNDIQKTIINDKIVKDLKNSWQKITEAIYTTIKFLSDNCGITSDREISSYISIIPIIYSVYNNDCQIKNERDIKKYIYRSFVLNIFSSRTNSRLVDLKKLIMDRDLLIDIEYIENKIPDFRIGEDKLEQILESEKSHTTQLTLFLMGNNNVFISRDGSEYHQDHIHASALFDGDKPYGISDSHWLECRKIRDKLPNLQLLKGRPNKSKSKKPLTEWFKSDDAPTISDFRNSLNLPDELSLKLSDFKEFYDYRKNLLKEELKRMLL
jgi:uncharacterized protein with ParB-like and HNH nuclease domain